MPEEMNKIAELIVATAAVDSIANPSVAVVPPPARLKVVHINEIGSSRNAVAQEKGKPYFPVNYPTKEIYSSSDASGKGGQNIIRIKLN